MDSSWDGRSEDAAIQPTSFPLFKPPEDMPTPGEIKARVAFDAWPWEAPKDGSDDA